MRRSERGANLVEAALVIPLLVLILVIAGDLGRAFFTYIALVDGAREGARYGAAIQNATAMCARAQAEALNQPLPVTPVCSADIGAGSGTSVSVTLSTDFELLIGGLLGRSTIPIAHTVAFRIR